ncbi:MAG: hypothetical protein E7388_03905 [Ruminococcaceae bacterium]|nr:hypothetical protein [Oscillospiraceae bacterium]
MKINDEYDYLIHLINCEINNICPVVIPEGLSMEQVYKHAVNHDVANIAFFSLEKLLDGNNSDLIKKWSSRQEMAVVRSVNQDFAADEIRSCLKAGNIRWLEMQGTKMKDLYPSPEYRTMSDIDFIVDCDSLSKCREILLNLGYEIEKSFYRDVVGFRKPNINVEFHSSFFYEHSEYYSLMPEVFDESYDECEIFCLYTILHLAKHYFKGGCGIRRILDIYFLDKFYKDILDGEYITDVMEQAGLTSFFADIRKLAQLWFNGGPEFADADEMKMYVCKSNVHGTVEHKVSNNSENSKLKYLFKRIFQDKEFIYKRYPFIEKHKFLLPVGWVMRMFYGITHFKQAHIDEEIKAVRKIKK